MRRFPKRRATLLSLFDRTKVFSYRYNILHTRWFSIGIHNIVNSDEPMLHTHDWSFMSYMLEGGYIEHMADDASARRPVGHWIYRHFTFRHFIQVTEPSWTLLIVGKKRNVHQFQTEHSGLIRWDLLIFGKLCDNFRIELTPDEARYALNRKPNHV